MNIKNSLTNLKIKMQQKNLLFVTNNIYESFLNLDEKNRTLKTIYDYILEINNKYINHESIQLFSLDSGEKNLKNQDSKFENKSITQFLDEIVQNINDKNIPPKTYLIDFGDYWMDSSNDNGEILIKIMQVISAILTSQNDNYSEITNNKKISKIIFLMRDAGNIVNFITNKNIEYSEVVINKPDLNERKELFARFTSRFDIINSQQLRNIESNVCNEAAILTEGMSNREILQLARIEGDNLTFKQLFYLATTREKDSTWEQFDLSKMNDIETFLESKVYGQKYAIQKTTQTLKRSFTGLAGAFQGINSNKPKGILFFCGPTGVGKTELAKTITEFVYKDKNRLIRFDMSEFAQEHSDQRLLGAPPGYVGFDGGGELTNAIKEKPNSIVLFDEIEKANPKILDKFLQILEDGRLTSSKGEIINFSETFIIFTSNIGASKVQSSMTEIEVRKVFLKEVYDHFRGNNKSKDQLSKPELLNRIGKENIIPFNFIKDNKILINMIDSKIHLLNDVIKSKYNALLKWEKSDIELILDVLKEDEQYDENDGGRGILELATKHIIDPFVDYVLTHINEFDRKAQKEGIKEIKMIIGRKKVSFIN